MLENQEGRSGVSGLSVASLAARLWGAFPANSGSKATTTLQGAPIFPLFASIFLPEHLT